MPMVFRRTLFNTHIATGQISISRLSYSSAYISHFPKSLLTRYYTNRNFNFLTTFFSLSATGPWRGNDNKAAVKRARRPSTTTSRGRQSSRRWCWSYNGWSAVSTAMSVTGKNLWGDVVMDKLKDVLPDALGVLKLQRQTRQAPPASSLAATPGPWRWTTQQCLPAGRGQTQRWSFSHASRWVLLTGEIHRGQL